MLLYSLLVVLLLLRWRLVPSSALTPFTENVCADSSFMKLSKNLRSCSLSAYLLSRCENLNASTSRPLVGVLTKLAVNVCTFSFAMPLARSTSNTRLVPVHSDRSRIGSSPSRASFASSKVLVYSKT